MAGETVITVVGNLTDDPELRFTPSAGAGASVPPAAATPAVAVADSRRTTRGLLPHRPAGAASPPPPSMTNPRSKARLDWSDRYGQAGIHQEAEEEGEPARQGGDHLH